MKTKNNAQEKVNGQVRKMISRSITVILSVVLISWTVGAQNFWEQVLTNQNVGNMAMTGTENPFEKSQANLMTATFEMDEADPTINWAESIFESIETELELQVETYDASEYVEAEISEEIENYRNTYTEISFGSIEATLELQVEKYNAADFVENEFSIEDANNNSNTSSFDTIEAELELQVDEYSAAEYVETEITNEAGLITDANCNETLEADLAPQMDQIIQSNEYNAENYVNADMAREIENARAQKEFLNKAENETAQEAVKEVEKYAMLLVSHINNDSK